MQRFPVPIKALLAICLLSPLSAWCLDLPKEMGKETAECVRCHRQHTPGVVYDWARSRHAWTRPEAAYEKPAATRRISAARVPDAFRGRVVGCFECHGQNPDLHPEAVNHMGYRIHVLVTPRDCEGCHPVEVGEFVRSRKASSYDNLAVTPLFAELADAMAGQSVWTGTGLRATPPGEEALRRECWGCHGAPLLAQGKETRRAEQGEMEVPVIANWPNQGIGRVNPDGSRGTCAACHGRHAFAVEDARHPEACARCHTGGHSPAWDAYSTSAHGGLYRAREPEFDWGNVPWVLGQDFQVPTCATCHASQVVNDEGVVLARRSHDFGSRIWTRLMTPPEPEPGPQAVGNGPKALPPVGVSTAAPQGGSAREEADRRAATTALCAGCHGSRSSQNYLTGLEETVRDTEASIGAATAMVREGRQRGLVRPEGLFGDPLEELWLEVWFLHATATRYGAAMGGPPNLGAPQSSRTAIRRALRAMERLLPPAPPAQQAPKQ